MIRLTEKYRPKTLADIIGQEKALNKLRIVINRSWGGHAYYLTGKSGTGKTSIARILADMNADKLYTIELVGRQLTVNQLKEIKENWMYIPMSEKSGQALIINESHGISKPVIEYLLQLIEDLPSNIVVIFTTTFEGADLFEEQLDSSPFSSRCINISLTQRDICEPLAIRAKEIADLEKLNGQPEEAYIKLLRKHKNNMRSALNDIESGCMLSKTL